MAYLSIGHTGTAISDGKAFELISGPVKKTPWKQVAKKQITWCISMLSASINIKILKHDNFFHRFIYTVTGYLS